jgi:lipopolysaccharide export system protein LptA
MKIILQNIKYALLLTGAFFLLPLSLKAQLDSIQLGENVKELILQGKQGRYLLRGNVVIKQGADVVYCDSAYYYFRAKYIMAYSNVHINKKDTLNLYCDSLGFDMNTEYAKLWGNVRYRDNEFKLVTDSMDFDAKAYRGVYKNGGVITSIKGSDKLTSRVGYLYPKSKDFFFRGDVQYSSNEYHVTTDTLKFNGRSRTTYFFGPTTIKSTDTRMFCEKGWYNIDREEGVLQSSAEIHREKESIWGDSLYYNAKEGLSIGKGNVVIRDTTEFIEFSGDYAYSSEKELFAFITGQALAKRFEDKQDTLYIHADTLFHYMDSLKETKQVLAHYGVKLFKKDLQGVCDSLSLEKQTGEMFLYHDPILWSKNAQLTGDTIIAIEQNGKMSSARILNDGLIVTEVDSAKYYNQIYGRNMIAHFDSIGISKVFVEGNAKTIYFVEDEKEKDTVIMVTRQGMNRIYSSSITLYFEDGEIARVAYYEAPDGVMYPMDQIKKNEERVEAFRWDLSRRPISWQSMILEGE